MEQKNITQCLDDSAYCSTVSDNDSASVDSVILGSPAESIDLPSDIVLNISQRYNHILGVFIENVRVIQSMVPPMPISEIPCIYPSQIMYRSLNRLNNYHMEYMILINDQILNYLLAIQQGTSRLHILLSTETIEIVFSNVRQNLVEFYSNAFNGIPVSIIENNIIQQWEIFSQGLENTNTPMLYEVFIFSSNFLLHMPPEQFQIFFESVINSIVDNNSVYHYHMIYTSWNVENIPLGYRNFQELFIESASVLKSIDNSFYEPTFREVVMTDLHSTTATLAQNAQAVTQSIVTTANISATAAFQNALVEQQINITAIPTGFSWGDVSQQVLSGVQWIIVNRIYVGSAVTVGIATWGILRQPISDWIGGILNPPRAIVDIQPIIDLQGNRGQFISPIPVNVPVPSQPSIIETLPIDGTPITGLPIDTILYLGENAGSIGVATVIVSIFVFALKKGGTIKIFSFFGR